MRRTCVPLLCTALITPFAFGQATTPATGQALQPSQAASAPAAAASAVSTGLTLDAAVQTALRQNPLLRAAEADVAASRGAIDQAGVLPNPSLGVDQEDTRRETRTTTVMLSQAFELGGKRAARVELARSGRDLAIADLAARQADVRAGTIEAFFNALIAQERVKVAEESLGIASSGSAAASRRVTAGKVSPTEETRARVAEATSRIELRQAQADRQSALRALSLVMGVPEASLSQLDGRADALPTPPTPEAVSQRLSQAPALRRAQSEVQRANAAYELERARRIPDVTVSLGAKRATEIGRNQPMIGVSIPLPFFDTNKGAQLETLRRRDAAQALAEAEEHRIRSEVLQTVDQLQARASEVQTLKQDVLPGAQSAYEAASRGFELGKFSFLEVLDAQRTWLQARTQYLQSLAEVHRAAAELERRLGSPNDRPNTGNQP
jgi:cobalt-zinc-cadmium efflux system outer membrane protein